MYFKIEIDVKYYVEETIMPICAALRLSIGELCVALSLSGAGNRQLPVDDAWRHRPCLLGNETRFPSNASSANDRWR